MKAKVRIPVEMKLVRDPKGKEKLKATVPMNVILDKSFDAKWLEEELLKFERKYLYLITCLRTILYAIRSQKQKEGRVLLYWEVGDKIVSFIENNKNNSTLFTENLTKSLIRDVGISEKIILRCKRFRINYPNVTQIDPARSFVSYVATFEKGYLSRKNKKGYKDEKN
ncbi:MAG: hypothetical protein QXX38_03595 [Candidatus Aenigmatarchaeota archaeon]